METLLANKAAFPQLPAPTLWNRSNSYISNFPPNRVLCRSACRQGSLSPRKVILRLVPGASGERCDSSRAWIERSGLRCRANSEGISVDFSGPHDDILESDVGAVDETAVTKVLGAVKEFVSTNFLIVVLSSSALLALAWPRPGRVAQQLGLTKWCTSAIFLISGFNMRSADTAQGLAAWQTGLHGLISILFITPLAAIPILSVQTSPRELVTGLAIFSCVPTTLASAVCLTQIAGANATLAIAMTVLSNLICIVTMPFTIPVLVGGGIGVSISSGQLLRSLVQTLLIPLLLGKVIRETFSVVAELVDGNRQRVSMICAGIQALVPWMTLSVSREMLLQIEPSNLLISAVAGFALHLAYLATNFILIKISPAPCIREDSNARAVLLVASQKSILVSIAVIQGLGGAFGDAGLLVLPCIAASFSQIIIDTILVNAWLQRDSPKQLTVATA